MNEPTQEKFSDEQIATLIRNLEETSYNEGSHDLACRCADALTVIRQLQAAARAPVERQATECRVDYLRANFTPFYLLANARRIASAEYKRNPNWVLAMNLFAVGSNSGIAICKEAGIDPDAMEVKYAAAPSAQGSSDV